MVTMKDISRRSGAGLATISRVINNSGYVAEGTRAKIEKAIQELGYRPNAGARMMRSGRSKLIGVLVPSIRVDFFARLAHRLEQALFAQGYQTLICSTSEEVTHESRYVEMLLAQQVDGVLMAAVENGDEAVGKLAAQGIPVLALDRRVAGQGVPLIAADHRTGGALAAEHLIALGHKGIAILGAPARSEPVNLRAMGAADACAAAGLAAPDIVLGDEHTVQACAGLAAKVLARTSRPTAIVATSDVAALGILHAARQVGIKVPEDLSVTGFDDTPMASYVFPALTTVAQPIDDMARLAIDRLLGTIKGLSEDETTDVILPVSLMVRQSSGQVP